MKPDFLTRMAAASRQRLEESRARCDETSLRRRAESRPPAVPLNLSSRGFDLIAEVKRRSPSMGTLADEAMSPAVQARHYADAGAAVISVLTEPDQFSGDIVHLEQVAETLKKEGLDIARRTVTKYRKALQIPSSRQRREWE